MEGLVILFTIMLFYLFTPGILVTYPRKMNKYLIGFGHAILFAIIYQICYTFLGLEHFDNAAAYEESRKPVAAYNKADRSLGDARMLLKEAKERVFNTNNKLIDANIQLPRDKDNVIVTTSKKTDAQNLFDDLNVRANQVNAELENAKSRLEQAKGSKIFYSDQLTNTPNNKSTSITRYSLKREIKKSEQIIDRETSLLLQAESYADEFNKSLAERKTNLERATSDYEAALKAVSQSQKTVYALETDLYNANEEVAQAKSRVELASSLVDTAQQAVTAAQDKYKADSDAAYLAAIELEASGNQL
jgi:chromosome segregation ATPase